MKNSKNRKKQTKKSGVGKGSSSRTNVVKQQITYQKKIFENISTPKKQKEKQEKNDQVQQRSEEKVENYFERSSSKQKHLSRKKNAGTKKHQKTSKNRLNLLQNYSPIQQRHGTKQKLDDSQIQQICEALENSNKNKNDKKDSDKNIASKKKNKSDSPNKKTMEDFIVYLEQEKEKEQEQENDKNQLQDYKGYYENKRFSLPDKNSVQDADDVLDQGFVQPNSKQKEQPSKRQKYSDLMNYSIEKLSQEHKSENKWESRKRYPRILPFLNESVKKVSDTIQIKRVSIDNKDNYLSKKPNSIYYHPDKLTNSKEQKTKEDIKREQKAMLNVSQIFSLNYDRNNERLSQRQKIKENFKHDQLAKSNVAQIFENDNEVKYRLNLEPGEQKEIEKTEYNLEIKLYKYTDTQVEVQIGSQKDKLKSSILTKNQIIKIPENNYYTIINNSKLKSSIGLKKLKEKDQLNIYIKIQKTNETFSIKKIC